MPTVEYPAQLPVMDRYGPPSRRVELFHRGDYGVPIDWALEEIPVPWLTITPGAGQVNQDHAIELLNVTVDWERVPSGFNDTVEVGITSTPAEYPYFDLIRIPVWNTRVPDDFAGFPETAGYISMEASSPGISVLLRRRGSLE